jgi:hypothetical protein
LTLLKAGQAMNRWITSRPARSTLALLLILALGLLFFLAQATLHLAADDLAWLRGDTPHPLDQYRQIPLFSFVLLHALFGPSAVAASALIVILHSLNILLLYRLGLELLGAEVAALAAAAVLGINPITLNTLTWISCLSYVQGACLALLALLAFLRSSRPQTSQPWLWAALALFCFGAGLFCSHGLFFLPVLFLVLGWLRAARWRGAVLFALGMVFALWVQTFVYDLGRYGVDASRLFSLDFCLAYASSVLSSGLALALAYPLSFFTRTIDFLRFCFAEPVRWGLTLALLAAGVLWGRRDRRWRLDLALLLCFAALITPYILRLYLTPDVVNFDISYVLSGRVFYLPYVAVGLGLGRIVAGAWHCIQGWRWAWAALLLPLVAYGRALWLYEPADFLGLDVVFGDLPQPVPPRWNPYASHNPAWFLLVDASLLLLFAWRCWLARRSHAGTAGPGAA